MVGKPNGELLSIFLRDDPPLEVKIRADLPPDVSVYAQAFTWSNEDLLGIPAETVMHHLNLDPTVIPV